jgi:UDP-glucose 4-epimerase
MKKENQTILVTGALGHIGSRLIRELPYPLFKNVLLCDNFFTQRYPSLVDLPQGRFNYKFFEKDITTADLNESLKGVDTVIHLAAFTNAEKSAENVRETRTINFEGLKRVADACKKVGAKLLFSSTASLYGGQTSMVDETCTNLKVDNPYAESKLAAEQYLQEMKKRGLRFVICRFGTIFGYSVGMRFHTAVNKFIWQALNGEPLTVWKTAWKQRRPYLDLEDCVRAMNFILENGIFNGEVYNVVTKNFTVEEIVTAIKEFVPDLKIAYVESPIMNELSYTVDDHKFRSLGFQPHGDLRKGIEGTIKQLQAIRANKTA